ncbi:hypothetical protein ASD84_16395 [Nocardioides sp. Root682]|nr:hypothetical protein ASD84_16395 [Nocardioides sp. Root682]
MFPLRVAVVVAATLVCLGAVQGGTPSAGAVFAPEVVSFDEPTEAELRDQFMAEEASLVAGADDLLISRQSSVTKSGTTTNFVIKAWVKSGSTYLYHQLWGCERRWTRPNACSNFEERRAEFFAAALNVLHHERSSRATNGFNVPKLLNKNEIDFYGGVPFFLVNNLSRERNQTEPSPSHTCLDVIGGYAWVTPGTGLQLRGCEFDRAEPSSTLPTDHIWRFVPGTSLLQNVLSGLCLDVAGPVTTQTDGSPVVVSACDFNGGWETADQRWGLHPLGYLVNLASGRCLDMNGASTTSNGAAARVVNCEYGLSAKLNSPGSSQGLTAADSTTDQSWSVSGLDSGLHPTLPSYPALDGRVVPPQTTITAAPPHTITHYDEVNIAFTSNMVGSTFECSFNDGGYVPCTSPFTHDTFRGERGDYSFRVRATNRYGLTDPTAAVALWAVVEPF